MQVKDQGRKVIIAAMVVVLTVTLSVTPVPAQSSGKPPATNETPEEWKPLESALGRKSQLQGSVLKFGMPRSDLKVLVGEVRVQPTLALGSWVAFDSPGKDAFMMGDLVLTENEVAPVMRALRQGGIEITALHNHVIQESPRVLYMHIFSRGDALAIARTMQTALSLTGTPTPMAAQVEMHLDVGALEQTLGYKGRVNGGVLQFSVSRSEAITDHGRTIPASMGLATAMNFQPVGEGRAAVTGDFVLLAEEVNPVVDSLTRDHITITALHSHMLGEAPRLLFLHFWAVDDAVELARALRAALDRTHAAKPTGQ